MEVVHIKKNTHTGEPIPEAVSGVSTDEASGTVDFAADGFSIFIGTVQTQMTYPSVMYWNGTNFYADEACTAEKTLVDAKCGLHHLAGYAGGTGRPHDHLYENDLSRG